MTALTDFQAAATTFLAAAATYAADAGAVASVTQGGYTFHFDTVGNTFVRSTETRTGAPSDSLDDFLLAVAPYRAARQSVVQVKSVSFRVALGGRCIFK